MDRGWALGADFSCVEAPLICREGESIQVISWVIYSFIMITHDQCPPRARVPGEQQCIDWSRSRVSETPQDSRGERQMRAGPRPGTPGPHLQHPPETLVKDVGCWPHAMWVGSEALGVGPGVCLLRLGLVSCAQSSFSTHAAGRL